ncbi:MAG: aminotransferase class I/II-fold pyridoxal phosphate-dependent enzyme [bacterium]|nr:aminotransferase class I/II-fold pyridoxal phosphate-dependent enzyme [bacterium]MDA1292614.1 aminotransferase class I/II-fold pyridoxal phosphate-dependent enzyme [bacterium]
MQSLKQLGLFWKWKTGEERQWLEETLVHWFDAPCSLFSSGREALLALLRNLPIDHGSEILIQGFTCVALPNAIHAAGFTPVFSEIDPATLNIDLEALEGKIHSRTKAIIVQHTFGIVADTEALRSICDKHGLLLIEDCAHVLPDVTGPKRIGKHADFLMLSFGRDKAASGISGGAIISKDEVVTNLLRTEVQNASELPFFTIKRLLLYPLVYASTKPLYGIGIGKALLLLASKCGALVPVISQKEKTGYQSTEIHRMPSALCALVRWEFKRFHSLNNHRRTLTKIYKDAAEHHNWNVPAGVDTHLPLQKFPLLVQDADDIRKKLKRYNAHLDDGWTGASVCPRSVSQEAAGYIPGSCPKAERLATQLLTLPTHPTISIKQAHQLIGILAKII